METGLRGMWQSPFSKIAFILSSLLAGIALVLFVVAILHGNRAAALESTFLERGYLLDSESRDFHDARGTASRARNVGILVMIAAGAAAFAGTAAGLPTRQNLETREGKVTPASRDATAPWPAWTRGRALIAGLGITTCVIAGLFLVGLGSFRATRFINNASPPVPEEEIRGAIEFIGGVLLLVIGPAVVAFLRRTVAWTVAAFLIGLIVGGWAVAMLDSWPPESSWSAY